MTRKRKFLLKKEHKLREGRRVRIECYIKERSQETILKIVSMDVNRVYCFISTNHISFEEFLLQLDIRNIKWWKITFNYHHNDMIYLKEGVKYLPKYPPYIYDRFNALFSGNIVKYRETFQNSYKKENLK